MPGSPATTTRHGLPRYGGSDAANFPVAVNALADAIDTSAPRVVAADVLSARPAASIAERLYFATDIGVLFRDTGSAWLSIQGSMTGVFASRPAAAGVGAGATYFATDVAAEYVSTGSAWVRNGMASGLIVPFGGGTAPAGYVVADGATLNSTASPQYADLFSAIGTTHGGSGAASFNVPDMRGRVAVGSGTGTGLTARALAATGGAETHTLTSAQIPSHTHTGSTASESAHTHGGTTAAENAHTHSVTVDAGGAHTPTAVANASGVPSTGDDTPDHTHAYLVTGDGFGGFNFPMSTTGASTITANWQQGKSSYASGGASARHTHPVTMNAVGNHTHTASSGAGSSHTHTYTSTANSGHLHTFTSSTDSTGGGSHPIMQPFGVATYLVKL
jgi:microcystin-dependent protein